MQHEVTTPAKIQDLPIAIDTLSAKLTKENPLKLPCYPVYALQSNANDETRQTLNKMIADKKIILVDCVNYFPDESILGVHDKQIIANLIKAHGLPEAHLDALLTGMGIKMFGEWPQENVQILAERLGNNIQSGAHIHLDGMGKAKTFIINQLGEEFTYLLGDCGNDQYYININRDGIVVGSMDHSRRYMHLQEFFGNNWGNWDA